MTTPLGATSSAATTPSATASTTKPGDSAMGPDAFMKLLVAQLKYQNPMAPTDGQAYMTQMATFTQVEKLDQLVKAQAEAQAWQQRVSAEGLVGRSVTGTTDGATTTGTVVGVRYAGGSALLELSGGGTLAASAVERVQQVLATAAAAPAAPSSTTPPSTTSTTTGTAPSSTTAPAAGTPSA
ncbi:MAG: flagellar hook capping protein [Frankiales bacterium]|nr:flagellar hook capping protein [Frankiales bacterium]